MSGNSTDQFFKSNVLGRPSGLFVLFFTEMWERFSSLVSLSFVTKLALVRYASLMMGLYFVLTGLGNMVAGLLGESASEYVEYTAFVEITIFIVIFRLLIILIMKPLKRLPHGAEDKESATNKEVKGFELADN